MTERRYDLCVIGAGPAGFAAAMRAHDFGKRVAIIEAGKVGGAGIHDGALSSKTLWHLSNDYARARRGGRGFQPCAGGVNLAEVQACVNDAKVERQSVFEYQLEALSAAGAGGGPCVDLIRGRAEFLDPHRLAIALASGETLTVGADYFLIATGSSPRLLPGIELVPGRIVTSDQVEHLRDFPRSMVIVGAGVVGCEYATVFGQFGRSKISLIDRQPRILPMEDEDVAACVARHFEDSGVRIHHASRLEELRVEGDQVRYEITDHQGQREVHHVDCALLSIGRTPNTDQLGLERAGVELDHSGIVVTEGTRAKGTRHIHAAGDVTADVALVNIAELEGRFAAESMFGGAPRPIPYDALSMVMFLSPEVASCGLNEQQAQRRGIAYRAGVIENQLVARNVAMRATSGFIKLLAGVDNKILGLRVVGPQASSTIQGVAFLIEQGLTLEAIEHCVHPHPVVPEGVQECARLLLGCSLYKPSVLGGKLLRVIEYNP